MHRFFANILNATAIVSLFVPSIVLAEADTFGLGTGRNNDVTFAANATPNTYTAITGAVAASATNITVASSAGYAAGAGTWRAGYRMRRRPAPGR